MSHIFSVTFKEVWQQHMSFQVAPGVAMMEGHHPGAIIEMQYHIPSFTSKT
jgi:hypothetical protein